MTHVFLDPDKRGARALDDAESLKAELAELKLPTAASRDLGDAFMLQSYYPERSEAEFGKLFGSEFAHSVSRLAPKQWHGPVLSGYGVHLVYVHERQEALSPIFSQVEECVRQDWEDDRRNEVNEKFIARLLARYNVIIEDVAPYEISASLE
jgi:parvulin-like peptidyl-prolyl isomerase